MPRQRVIEPERKWRVCIGNAKFILQCRNAAKDPEIQAIIDAERLVFLQKMPEEYKTFRGIQPGPSADTARSYNLGRRHPKTLNRDEKLEWADRGVLGKGGQGYVVHIIFPATHH